MKDIIRTSLRQDIQSNIGLGNVSYDKMEIIPELRDVPVVTAYVGPPDLQIGVTYQVLSQVAARETSNAGDQRPQLTSQAGLTKTLNYYNPTWSLSKAC